MKHYLKTSLLLICTILAFASCRNENKETSPVEEAVENLDSDAEIKIKDDKIKMEDENTKVKIKTDEDGSVEKIKTKETN